MLDYEILKQAIKEHIDQETEQEQLQREKIQLQREKIQLQKEQLDQKRKQQAKKEQEQQKPKKHDASIIASLIISFLSFAIMTIFYIVLMIKY